MVKPNFFIIGAPKCGTTALSEYLRTHPNIFISADKEPNYFNTDFMDYPKIGLEKYLDLFSTADPLVHLAVGEATPSYLWSKTAVSEILKFNPEAKFIVMLRNPVEMVHARHSQLVFNGQENIFDFEKAWRAEKDRIKNNKKPSLNLDIKRYLYSESGLFGEQIERLFSTANRKNIQVILFEDFVGDTKGVYQEVLYFLNVPDDGRKDFPKINESKRLRFPWLQYAFGVFNEFVLNANIKLGLKGKIFIKTGLRSLNWSYDKRKPITEEFRSELEDFYRDDVKKLSSLLGRDLSHWIAKATSQNDPE